MPTAPVITPATLKPVAGSRRTAVIIGQGDGTITRHLTRAAIGFERVITVRLHGEPVIQIPGHVFDATRGPAELIRTAWALHKDLIALADAEFFDSHPILTTEDQRAAFAIDFYRLLADKPLDFGDNILDGLQGAYHVAFNARHILPGPLPREIGTYTCPAIAVASGPSLAAHIPAIQALVGKVLIVASDSAVDGLLRAGIRPDFVTPVERIPEIGRAFSQEKYDLTFAGKGVTHHDVTAKFSRHMFAPCTDALYAWAGAHQDDMRFYGQSTGVMAVTLATQLTTGTVYLAGHDLALDPAKASHWNGAKAVQVHEHETFPTRGYSGEVLTDWWWDQFRTQIEAVALASAGRVVNLNALTGVGAVIMHTLPGALPDPASLCHVEHPAWPEPNTARLVAFQERCRRLPKDVDRILGRLGLRNPQPEDLDMFGALCPNENGLMLAYVIRSLYAQFSYETYAGKTKSTVARGLRDAMVNVLEQCKPMFKAMADAC